MQSEFVVLPGLSRVAKMLFCVIPQRIAPSAVGRKSGQRSLNTRRFLVHLVHSAALAGKSIRGLGSIAVGMA